MQLRRQGALLSLVMAGLLVPAAASAGALRVPSDTTACDIAGFLKAKPEGAKLREAPEDGAGIVATLTPPSDAGADAAYGVLIVGDYKGWLLAYGARLKATSSKGASPAAYSGFAWVAAADLMGRLAPSQHELLDQPSDDAAAHPFAKSPAEIEVSRVVECSGPFAHVETSIGAGWVRGLCSNVEDEFPSNWCR